METRGTFDRELQSLTDELLALGTLVQQNLRSTALVLRDRNISLSHKLIDEDRVVNARRIELGMRCLRLIATQQPIARDMRLIATVIEVVGELERIHDYVKGIARINLMLSPEDDIEPLVGRMSQMADIASSMLEKALRAFIDRDATLASTVPALDDQVDALFNDLYGDIVRMSREQPESLVWANRLEWASHNLERSADRVINICEWVVYMVTGRYVEFESEFESPPS